MIRRIISSLILISLVLGGAIGAFRFLLSLRQDPQRSEASSPYITVCVLPLKRGVFQERLAAYGVARPLAKSEIAAEVPGVVRWISPRLEVGGEVTEDEKLVELDSKDFQEAFNIAKSTLAQSNVMLREIELDIESLKRDIALASKELAAAQREFTRLRESPQSVSPSVLDNQFLLTSGRQREILKLEWQMASKNIGIERIREEIEMRKSQLVKAQNDLTRTVIRAPYDGRVDARHVQLGSYVIPATPLFGLLDTSKVEVVISLSAVHFNKVKQKKTVLLRRREEGPVIWKGAVTRISPVMDSSRMFNVFCEVRSKTGTMAKWWGWGNSSPIPPGEFVVAQIDGPSYRDVFVIPRAAFIGQDVFLVKRQSKDAREAIVTVLQPHILYSFNDFVLVDRGLNEGDEVVVTNLEEIANGSRVIAIVSALDSQRDQP